MHRLARKPLQASYSTLRQSSQLSQQTCLITGASRGIGQAITAQFAHANAATLILVGRNAITLSESAEQIDASSSAQRCVVRAGDVAERAFWEELGREFKGVDVLVNAAGVAHASLLVGTKVEVVERVVRTNLMGAIWGCQVMLKNMMRQRKGCIINVSSLLGVKGGRGSSVYAASKAGVIGLTRSLAAEAGPSGIRVNAIVPGYIKTQMTEEMSPQAISEALQSIPTKRFGDPEDIAEAAVFLATSRYASNCVLNLDGGLSAM
ncbi:MAG: hypothetical protein M1829_006868 [Trizodia sp. TS-e1964]|nr:MAG: hypothetical protein M1829_006868 [Trizodia sp. TS-e1964]